VKALIDIEDGLNKGS